MNAQHKILDRHLRNLGLSEDTLPSDLANWKQFIKKVESSFHDYDQGRYLLERSIEISSIEMKERADIIEQERAKSVHSAKMATLGEMAGGIAHEINNPLAIISGKVQNLITLIENPNLTKNLTPNMDMAGRFLKDIKETVNRITKIVNGLRTFSRHEGKESFRPVKVSDLIQDTIALCRERFQSQGIAVEIITPPAEMLVECRPIQISQVLLNLLNNAHDAIKHRDERWIKIDAQEKNGTIELRICDSGKGISNEIKAKIFQPFFTTKPVGEGTGLGLSISYGIVQAHGGTIVATEVDGHTCFIVKLPSKHEGSLINGKFGD